MTVLAAAPPGASLTGKLATMSVAGPEVKDKVKFVTRRA